MCSVHLLNMIRDKEAVVSMSVGVPFLFCLVCKHSIQCLTGNKIPAGAREQLLSQARAGGTDSGQGQGFLVKVWSLV